MTVVAIVQARVNSTRLPGKVVANIVGKPVLWHVMRRALAAKRVDQVVLATSVDSANAGLRALAGLYHWEFCCSAPENDVLARFHDTARFYAADEVVRLTGDCPCLDPKVIDAAVDLHAGVGGYVSNLPPEVTGYPDGLDVEVFDIELLAAADKFATDPSDREHVTTWIQDLAKTKGLLAPYDLSQWKLSVDTLADLKRVAKVHVALGPGIFGFDELVEHLEGAKT